MKRYLVYEDGNKLVGEFDELKEAQQFVKVIYENETSDDDEYDKDLIIIDKVNNYEYSYSYGVIWSGRRWFKNERH